MLSVSGVLSSRERAILSGYFAASGAFGGDGDSTCDNALKPLGTSIVDGEAFAQQDVAMTRVIDLLNQGDRAGAEAAFYGPVHGFTHNADPPLREVDEGLAKQLCRNVIELENATRMAIPAHALRSETFASVESIAAMLKSLETGA